MPSQPTPNLPPGFDFTDPDIYAERLPVDELAEMRRSRADLVERTADRGGRVRRRRLLGGDQAQGRQGGVACAATSSPACRRPPCRGTKTAPSTSRSKEASSSCSTGRPAPHPPAQDHLARLHSPRCRAPARRSQRARPRHRRNRRRARFRRLRRAGVLRVAAAGHRRPDRCAAGRPHEAVSLVQPDGRRPGSRVRHQ